ncbi:MAG: hypothetical protein HYZ28_28595 [Myxococcales bacterium]|nr:hypothetical protein [Myxococcales bacterium]
MAALGLALSRARSGRAEAGLSFSTVLAAAGIVVLGASLARKPTGA